MWLLTKYLFLLNIFLVVSCSSFSVNGILHNDIREKSNPTENIASVFGIGANSVYYVDRIIDLNGESLWLPQGVTLCFTSGYFKNGILVGNKTKIKCSGIAFDNITIKGSWHVPDISTKMFADLNYENALKNVFALANPMVRNTITIEKGDYIVKANKNNDACLSLCGNTELILNGIIRIIPNEYPRYDIIRAEGGNITIRGNGMIIGDKQTHLGQEGEWGMGIRFHGAINASVSGLRLYHFPLRPLHR